MRMQVLIVEDSTPDYLIMSHALEAVHPDIDLHRAETLEAAREQLGLCDVVILDLTLPDSDSLDCREALEFIKASNRPVVIYSGNDNPDVIVATAQAGALSYVCKGSPARQLVDNLIFARAEFERTCELKAERWKRLASLCDRLKAVRAQ